MAHTDSWIVSSPLWPVVLKDDDAFDAFRLLSDSTAESQATNKSIDGTSVCHAATLLAVEYNESSHLHLVLFIVFNLVCLDAECLLTYSCSCLVQVHIDYITIGGFVNVGHCSSHIVRRIVTFRHWLSFIARPTLIRRLQHWQIVNGLNSPTKDH